jgi:aldose 1-epimerase
MAMISGKKMLRAIVAVFLLACMVGAANVAKAQAAAMAKSAGVERAEFGKLDDGTVIEKFTLHNANGATAKLITYGATLTELWMPDRAGKEGDVVLGFDSLKGYLGQHPYFGATIGRYGNRIAGGKFTLDGADYTLPQNNGPNTLHGGKMGFDKRVWKGKPVKLEHGAEVRFTYTSADGEEGFPGTLNVTVVYMLTDENSLKIEYTATTDKATPVNLTNHSYFNLASSGDVLGYTLWIGAEHYTPVDKTLIPTGEIAAVKGTPYDFTKPATIGSRMGDIKDIGGYDINYVLNGKMGTMRKVAQVDDPASGREMEVWTTEPGVQIYNAIGLNGSLVGVGGVVYPKYGAICLETQHYPDSVHRANFPSVILQPGKTYHSMTIYKFAAK